MRRAHSRLSSTRGLFCKVGTSQIGDILETLKDLAGVVAETRIDEARTRNTDVPLVTGETAREALGSTAATPWRQTPRDVLADWRHRIAAEPGMS